MQYELEIRATILISVEFGAEDTARRLARDHVCNDWLLRYREGTAKDAGKFAIKGMSGVVVETRHPGSNPNVVIAGSEEDEIF